MRARIGEVSSLNDDKANATPVLTIPFAEYIVLSAFLTALTALSIDIMLPALPAISDEFRLSEPNDRQLVVIIYFVGFGFGQLIWGPLSDRFGRLPVLAFGLAIFVAGSIIAVVATSFEGLLIARAIQGLGSGAPRITVMAVARDLFVGARMSRVMSLIMTVFIFVPLVAPALGQGLLYLGSWRLLFLVILAAGVGLLVWSQLRLPETRPRHLRGGQRIGLGHAMVALARERMSVTYMIATGMLFSCLCAFIAGAQQILGELYGLGDVFVFAFSAIAFSTAAAALTNARIVMRRGMRTVCHVALAGFVILAGLLAVVTWFSVPPLGLFMAWLGCLFYLFGLVTPNFNAIVLEPMGEIAGLAASVLGFSTTLLAAGGGWLIGSAYDGTLFPLAAGFTLFGGVALVLVFSVEGPAGMFRDPASSEAR